MDYYNESHPFFKSESIREIISIINHRLQNEVGAAEYTPDDYFIDSMMSVAKEYPQHLITSDPVEGVKTLQTILVRRILKSLTTVEEAGQYYKDNHLFENTRLAKRSNRDVDSLDDYQNHASSIILGGNVYRRHFNDINAREREFEKSINHGPYHQLYNATRPKKI